MPSIVPGIAPPPGYPRRWRFAPRLVTSLAALVAVLLFVRLGVWQMERADQARAAQVLRAEAAQQPATDLGRVPVTDMAALLWRPVIVSGAWRAKPQVLLDNQIESGRAGYRVYGLLRPTGCSCALLVDRGWIATGPDRATVAGIEDLPEPGMPLSGRLVPLPAAGIGVRNDVESLAGGALRLQRLDAAVLPTEPGIRILPLVLQLVVSADADGARDYGPQATSRADRHTAYAVQWFGFALIATILYLVLNLKRR